MAIANFKRRLIRQHESLYVAIPKSWALANDLDRYMSVDIQIAPDGSLRISRETNND